MASPSRPLRRITRASLARFTLSGGTAETTAPDIEDTIPPATIATTAASSPRKRKRTAPKSSQGTLEVRVRVEEPETAAAAAAPTSPSPSPRGRGRRPARTIVDPTTRTETVRPPTDWEQAYNAVMGMRVSGAATDAAVDTMGCERLALPTASLRDQRFHTLVALMLSSQTKDTTTAAAMARLHTDLPSHQAGAPPGLNVANMLAVEPETLNRLIRGVGFHNHKTAYLKNAAEMLHDRWHDDIPDSIEGLVSLPGVGPKMAHLCLSSAWGRTEGIGVDVHVHRITNLWGWHRTKTPEETRLALQSWLPRDKWREINWLLVGLGQTICRPRGRKCGDCELGLSGLCKAAERAKVTHGRKLRELKLEPKLEPEPKLEREGDSKVIKMEEDM